MRDFAWLDDRKSRRDEQYGKRRERVDEELDSHVVKRVIAGLRRPKK